MAENCINLDPETLAKLHPMAALDLALEQPGVMQFHVDTARRCFLLMTTILRVVAPVNFDDHAGALLAICTAEQLAAAQTGMQAVNLAINEIGLASHQEQRARAFYLREVDRLYTYLRNRGSKSTVKPTNGYKMRS